MGAAGTRSTVERIGLGLLALGLSAYGPAETESEEPGEPLFNQRVEDQQDPVTREGARRPDAVAARAQPCFTDYSPCQVRIVAAQV